MEDYYKVLQVDPQAEQEIVEAAYRRLSKKYHPDVNKDPATAERMREINEAYAVLSDTSKRTEYDRKYFAQKGKKVDGEPVIAVRPEVLDFGSLAQGEVARTNFVIENRGAPLAGDTLISIDDTQQTWAKVTSNISYLAEPGQLPIQAELKVSTARLSAPKTHEGKVLIRVDGEEKAQLLVRVMATKRGFVARTLARTFRKIVKVAPEMLELGSQLTLIVISGYVAKKEVQRAIRSESPQAADKVATHLHILTTSVTKAAEISDAVARKLREED